MLVPQKGGRRPDGDAAGGDKDKPLRLPEGGFGPLGKGRPLQAGEGGLAGPVGEGPEGAGVAAVAPLFQLLRQFPGQQGAPRGEGDKAKGHFLSPFPSRKLWENPGSYSRLRR